MEQSEYIPTVEEQAFNALDNKMIALGFHRPAFSPLNGTRYTNTTNTNRTLFDMTVSKCVANELEVYIFHQLGQTFRLVVYVHQGRCPRFRGFVTSPEELELILSRI